MSTPLKPWEQRNGIPQQLIMNSAAPLQQMLQTPVGRLRSGLPQLPPRPGVNSYGSNPAFMGGSYPRPYNSNYSYGHGSYGGMGGGYGNYGGFGMGGYGGMYGGMYGGNGYGMGPESRFIQLAEESTRPAFQSIESLVRAFSSISMMLDSTFFAVSSSFRAVLGVAENFGQIRTMFGQVWSSFALIRLFTWLYRKILRLFGVKVVEDLGKEAWSQAVSETGAEVANNNVSSWPIFMFLGMIITAPYFISRLLPPIIDKSHPKHWTEPGRKAVAQFPFQASNAQELSVRPGEEILLAPKSIQDEMQLSGTGWVLASAKNNSFGLLPVNYIQVAGVRQKVAPKTNPPAHNLKLNNPATNEQRVFPIKNFHIDEFSNGNLEKTDDTKIKSKESLNTTQSFVSGSSQINSSELPK